MEPVVLIGLIGSIASIISLLQQNKRLLEPRQVLRAFVERTARPQSVESRLRDRVSDKDVLEKASVLINIAKTDAKWLDRIRIRCLQPYYEAIENYGLDDADLEDVRGGAATCVCSNIKMARRDNGGHFPSDEFKQLWKQFGCD